MKISVDTFASYAYQLDAEAVTILGGGVVLTSADFERSMSGNRDTVRLFLANGEEVTGVELEVFDRVHQHHTTIFNLTISDGQLVRVYLQTRRLLTNLSLANFLNDDPSYDPWTTPWITGEK